jgi:hypothetical protein
MEAPAPMDVATFGTWIAVALQFIAAGTAVIWPDRKWIAWLVMLLVVALWTGGLFVTSNYPERISALRGSWFLLPCGMALGLALAWSVFKLYPASNRAESPTIGPMHTETMIRLRQSSGNKFYFESETDRNIHSWRQTYVRAEDHSKGEAMIHSDTFFLIFNRPIKYAWPTINSFGYKFPIYNFWMTSDRGVVLQINGEIETPVFEVCFPPPIDQDAKTPTA